jgi:hypothetical protein
MKPLTHLAWERQYEKQNACQNWQARQGVVVRIALTGDSAMSAL